MYDYTLICCYLTFLLTGFGYVVYDQIKEQTCYQLRIRNKVIYTAGSKECVQDYFTTFISEYFEKNPRRKHFYYNRFGSRYRHINLSRADKYYIRSLLNFMHAKIEKC